MRMRRSRSHERRGYCLRRSIVSFALDVSLTPTSVAASSSIRDSRSLICPTANGCFVAKRLHTIFTDVRLLGAHESDFTQ